MCNQYNEICGQVCYLSTKTPFLLPGHPVRPQVSMTLAVWGGLVTCLCQQNVRKVVHVTSEARLSEAVYGLHALSPLPHKVGHNGVSRAT